MLYEISLQVGPFNLLNSTVGFFFLVLFSMYSLPCYGCVDSTAFFCSFVFLGFSKAKKSTVNSSLKTFTFVYICICLLVGIISVKLEMSISPSMLTRCRYGQCLLNCNRYLTGSESIQYAE